MNDCLRIVTLALLCVAGSGAEARESGRSLGALDFEPCTLSAIEHSVTRTTRDGRVARMCPTMPAVDPT